MFGNKKKETQIDKEQLELIQNAQKRIKQKKRLYAHFVLFLIGCILLIVANTVLGIGAELTLAGVNWFVYAILIWTFLLLYHIFNVFITHKFMGKAWEEKQLDKLVTKQKIRISKLQQSLNKADNLKGDIVGADNLSLKKHSKVNTSNLTLIVAAAENNAIGLDNALIWHLKDDLKRFKSLTSGHRIIMGRKTFESFPKPLPNRTHIVITRKKNYKVPDGVIIVNSIEDAIDAAKEDKQPFIIGGGEIYKQSLNFVDKIELTRVHETFSADTFFPEIDKNIWTVTNKIFNKKDANHAYDFSFITFERA